MRLRRVSEHVKSQNWLAVALDFLIVVVGVFLGLQAQAWNQERIDRNREQGYLDRLATDFVGIESQLQRCVSLYEDSIEAINFVSNVVKAEDPSESVPDRKTFADALIRITAGTLPAARSATFVEMVSAGDLSILRNEELRNALIAYDQQAQTNREIWHFTREQVNAYLHPLYENAELSIDLEGEQYASIPDYDLPAMAQSQTFRTMLNVLAGAKANTHELCRYQRTLADSVRGRLPESEN